MFCLFGRVVTIAFVVSFAGCSTVHMSSVKNTSKTFNTVVVDAGHGGKDSGAYRRYGPPEKWSRSMSPGVSSANCVSRS